jgi:hypothetical protein
MPSRTRSRKNALRGGYTNPAESMTPNRMLYVNTTVGNQNSNNNSSFEYNNSSPTAENMGNSANQAEYERNIRASPLMPAMHTAENALYNFVEHPSINTLYDARDEIDNFIAIARTLEYSEVNKDIKNMVVSMIQRTHTEASTQNINMNTRRQINILSDKAEEVDSVFRRAVGGKRILNSRRKRSNRKRRGITIHRRKRSNRKRSNRKRSNHTRRITRH